MIPERFGLKRNIDLLLFVDDGNVWGWTDGSPWNYSNWNPGKPENPNKGMDHALFGADNGGWYDQKKDIKRTFICQCDAI